MTMKNIIVAIEKTRENQRLFGKKGKKGRNSKNYKNMDNN